MLPGAPSAGQACAPRVAARNALLVIAFLTPLSVQIMPEYDVIVIGSGISGMSAASWLHKNSMYRVLVLEAQSRVGGRTKTLQISDDDRAVDLGAGWIHGTGSKRRPNPVLQLSNEHGIDTITVPEDVTYFLPGGNKLTLAQENAIYEVLKKFNEYRYAYQIQGEADEPISTLLSKFLQSDGSYLQPDEQRLLRNFLDSEVGNEYADDLSNLSALYIDAETEDWPGDEAIFPGGYQQLVEALAFEVPVCLNQEVTSINYSGDIVTIQTESGLTATSSRVIVTMPLGYLQKHSESIFKPALPRSIVEALDSMSMGVLNKCILMWDTAWWEEMLTTDWVIRVGYEEEEAFREFYNLMATDAELPIIIAFSFGDSARELESLSDEDTVLRALRSLQATVPEGTEIPRPSSTAVSRWGSDPWTYGSYSRANIGQISKSKELQKAVDGKVFFAGEHTSIEYPSTVHGALLSGRRAAEQIASSMSQEIKGSDQEHICTTYVATSKTFSHAPSISSNHIMCCLILWCQLLVLLIC